MASLQIRELPPEVYEGLAAQAEREGRSLAQQAIAELRRLPALQARQRRLETLRQIRADLPNRPGCGFDVSPEDLVGKDRDR